MEHQAVFSPDYQFDGILGLYSLSNALFLEIIVESVAIGNGVSGNPVYKVSHVEFVKLPSSRNEYANVKYISMLQNVLSVANLYYSHHEDLTKRLQDTLCEPLSDEDRVFPSSMDPMFMFNSPIIAPFAPFKDILPRDLIPITIFGFMKIVPAIAVNGVSFKLILVSRRSIYRNGRRYNTRGIDANAHVANFVETEQIAVQDCGIVTSYVQIRGSIPLVWSQKPTMKYTPRISVDPDRSLLTTHFNQLIEKYGHVIVVNLIDKKKDQLMIGNAFESACAEYNGAANKVEYFWFDFHAECKKMHYENIAKLVDMTHDAVQKGEYFKYDLRSKQILNLQSAVIRTNCIDCLDRTNVVQSVYAKELLMQQLFGESYRSVHVEPSSDLTQVLNNVWSDNADEMSLLYSSSRSLKTDYTRTGKRTVMGAISDGVNSLIRYVNNNFRDGYFEDCLNLTFDLVKIDEVSDKLVLQEKRSTLGSFATVVLLPISVVCYLISRQAPEQLQYPTCFMLIAVSYATLFSLFVKKGTKLGEAFVSRVAVDVHSYVGSPSAKVQILYLLTNTLYILMFRSIKSHHLFHTTIHRESIIHISIGPHAATLVAHSLLRYISRITFYTIENFFQ